MSRGNLGAVRCRVLCTEKPEYSWEEEKRTGKAPTRPPPDCPVMNLFTIYLNVTVTVVPIFLREQHTLNDSFNTWALGQWDTETLTGLVLAL